MTRSVHLSELDVLSVVEVGSTIWNMQTPLSDVDYFASWAVDPMSLLDGTYSEAQRNHRTKMVSHDYPGADKNEMEATEAAHCVHLVLQSNINAIQRALSPIRHVWTDEAQELADIVQNNRAKNVYDSVNGMNSANLKRYWQRVETEGAEFGAKKAGQIMRVVRCAIRVLDGKPYTFEPVSGVAFEDCVGALDELKAAYEASTLPERPDEEPYREWLLNLRLSRLHENLK